MTKPPAVLAAEALSDLNTFAIIEALAEGSFIHAPSFDAASHIANICRIEQQICLRRYDEAMAGVATGGRARRSREAAR